MKKGINNKRVCFYSSVSNYTYAYSVEMIEVYRSGCNSPYRPICERRGLVMNSYEPRIARVVAFLIGVTKQSIFSLF